VTRPIEEYIRAAGLPESDYLGLDATYQRVNASLAIALSHVWLNEHKVEKDGTPASHPVASAAAENLAPSGATTPKVFELFKPSLATLEGIKQYHWPGRAQIMWLVGKPIKYLAVLLRIAAECS